MSINYHHALTPVRAEFGKAHQRFWERLANPGNWWTGAQRVAIAAEARHAVHCPLCQERKTALSPYTVTGEHARVSRNLPETAVDVVHRIMTDAGRLTRHWHESVCADDLTQEAYIEIVGTVVSLISIDQFCRAIGVDLHPLPQPKPGVPSGYRPIAAQMEEAWVPLVPAENGDTPEVDLWPSGRTGNVIRAMSLVPNEVRTLADLSSVHYLPHAQVRDPLASQGCLDRAQMELIAGRVSALNGCFY